MSPAIGWPLDHNRIRRGLINHTFGMVRRNADGSRRPHQGWDFEAVVGTPCYAVADGQIVDIRRTGDYGLQIILRFSFDFDGNGKPDVLYAAYCHLSAVEVDEKAIVRKGELLGLTGNTGNAVGMGPADQHLHFEVRDRAFPGRGLTGRYSPMVLFGHCPLHEGKIR